MYAKADATRRPPTARMAVCSEEPQTTSGKFQTKESPDGRSMQRQGATPVSNIATINKLKKERSDTRKFENAVKKTDSETSGKIERVQSVNLRTA
eukprot:scaffold2097_cov403-Prasinococcus_capsulatus_cf.AAC.14